MPKPAPRQPLTDAALHREPLAPSGQKRQVRDTTPNFFAMVGAREKTFMIQVDVRDTLGKRRSVKEVIGHFPAMSVKDARALARARVGELQAQGKMPDRRPDVTLGDAWNHLLKTDASRLRAKTVYGYKQTVRLRMEDWLPVSLARLADNPAQIAERHAKITQENGPYAANAFARLFRHLYRLARARLDPQLRPLEIGQVVHWNKEARRKTGVDQDGLAAWHAQLVRLPNPIRREFHLLSLLSGSRPTALAAARWDHLDMKRRALHIPAPKGGEHRAFDIPLSRPMLAALARVRRDAQEMHPEQSARRWIFPADSSPGHLVEWKETRTAPKVRDGAKENAPERPWLSKWGNDLRQTYVIAAETLDISERTLKRLLNHATPDVTMGYGDRNRVWPRLLEAQAAISAHLMQHWIAPSPRRRPERI